MIQDEMIFSLHNVFYRKTFDVDVTVNYGRLKQDLQTVKLVYQLDGNVVQEKIFNYLDHKVADHKHHQIKLPTGNYLVIIELRYPGFKSQHPVTDEIYRPKVEVLRIHRSLLVQGNTKITLFLDPVDQS